jgi:hypothetical protein
MILKKFIFEVVVVARATRPPEELRQKKRKWHHPWCGEDTCTLGWGIGMHQAIVWVKAADHHGASGITFSSVAGAGVDFLTQKVSHKYHGTFLRKFEDKYNGHCKIPLKLVLRSPL